MKTTKKHIRENIHTTPVNSMNLGSFNNYLYQHDANESFELHHNHPMVMHNLENTTLIATFELEEATTKENFIQVVYDFLNER